VPSKEQDAPQGRRRVPLWLLIVAGGVAVVLAGLVGGAIVAATDRGPDLTSVGCVTSSVAERTLPAVVTIHVQAGAATGSGSGEVIRSDGYILTNNHVISAAAGGGSITVLFTSGDSHPARLIGRDVPTDLA
jgi:putative serine protease PepD